VIAKRSNRIPVFSRIKEVLSGERNVKKLIEFVDFEFDKVVVEYKDHRNKKKNIDLESLHKIIKIPLSDSIINESTGHPEFEKIDKEANIVMNDYYEIIKSEING
jgi:hypothetical protein